MEVGVEVEWGEVEVGVEVGWSEVEWSGGGVE